MNHTADKPVRLGPSRFSNAHATTATTTMLLAKSPTTHPPNVNGDIDKRGRVAKRFEEEVVAKTGAWSLAKKKVCHNRSKRCHRIEQQSTQQP